MFEDFPNDIVKLAGPLVFIGIAFFGAWIFLGMLPGIGTTGDLILMGLGCLSPALALGAYGVWSIKKLFFDQPDETYKAPPTRFANYKTVVQKPIETSKTPVSTITNKSENPSGYVYIIQDVSNTGYFKIGRTNNLDRRLGSEFTKFPFDWKIVQIIPSNDENKLENDLQTKFADKRKRGEWFDLAGSDLFWLKNNFPSVDYRK